MKNDNELMPYEIWALNYEGDMGHGEWDSYQPFDPNMATKYIRANAPAQSAVDVRGLAETVFRNVPHGKLNEHVIQEFVENFPLIEGCLRTPELINKSAENVTCDNLTNMDETASTTRQEASTDEKRVMDMMAYALVMSSALLDEPERQKAENALAEYEKLKGKNES